MNTIIDAMYSRHELNLNSVAEVSEEDESFLVAIWYSGSCIKEKNYTFCSSDYS
jgi:hypothetical protein